MDITSSFLIYAAFFRVAVIVAGVVAMVLGYRLFVVTGESTGNSSAEGELGRFKFAIKNAAPGTCFALFGAMIIVAMLIQGNPELVIAEIEKLDAATGNTEVTRSTQLKGGDDERQAETLSRFRELVAEGDALGEQGDHQAAIIAYGKALSMPDVTLKDASMAFNGIAWTYFEQQRIEEALPLARLAVQLIPNNAAYLDTLANLLLARGESADALTWAKQAVQLSPGSAALLATLANAYRANGEPDQALVHMKRAAGIDRRYEQELMRFQQH